MAVIGPMKYLTIGSDTYEIDTTPPIASSSRLGGIKVGTGLSIDATTGVLSATGTSITIDSALSTSSTNPVQNKVITNALNGKVNSTSSTTLSGVTWSGSISNSDGHILLATEDSDTGSGIQTAISLWSQQIDFSLMHGESVSISIRPQGTYIDNVPIPTSDYRAANKKYVDDQVATRGTVNSVRVQATSPVQSSVNTAQSSSLDTTISLANGYGDTKNPYGTKTANYVLAGPTSGSAAAPTFRALVASDIPSLSGMYLPLTGGTVSGATIFSNSVSIENLTAGDTLVNGSASFTNGLTTSGLIATGSADGESHVFDGTNSAVVDISYTNGTAASFTRGTFSQGTLPSLTFAINGSDSGQLDISWSAGTLPTHAADSFTPNVPTKITNVTQNSGYWFSTSIG